MEGVKAEGIEYSYGMHSSNDNSMIEESKGPNIFSMPRISGEDTAVRGNNSIVTPMFKTFNFHFEDEIQKEATSSS
jgi:hypothetical protein